jgi:hypothetical protein
VEAETEWLLDTIAAAQRGIFCMANKYPRANTEETEVAAGAGNRDARGKEKESLRVVEAEGCRKTGGQRYK